MTTALAPEHHVTYEHLAVVHDGPEALAAHLAPLVDAAVADGDAVLVCFDDRTARCVRERIARPDEVTFMAATTRYARPGVAAHALHAFLGEAQAAGAPAVWSIGSIPYEHTELDRRWLRYEAAVDEVLGHLPLHAICTYDRDVLPAHLVDAAHHSHHAVHGSSGPSGPPPVMASLRPELDPVLVSEVTTTAAFRRALIASLEASVDRARLDDVLLAASEVATNALLHGGPPVTASVWADRRGVVVEVTDHGPPVGDPHAHLRPLDGGAEGGFGLWLVGELADDVTIGREGGANVVRAHFATT